MKLLVVDDSNIVRTRIARVAERGRIGRVQIVGLARNGEEALRAARLHLPDVVTMDLTMPQMGGLECISQLVKLQPSLYILVISALTDKSTAIRALKLGARGFVAKPFTDEELELALMNLMQRK